MREIPDFEWDEHSLVAFEAGDAGWGHCRATLRFMHGGLPREHRFSFVLVLEDGFWKLAHMNTSNPTSNVKKMGIEHTALNRLVDAARDGFRQNQFTQMASIMFTDIVNSTGLADVLGDRTWAALARDHLDLFETQIREQGGLWVNSLGDDTTSSFPSARSESKGKTRPAMPSLP